MAEEIEVFEHTTEKDFLADKSIASKYTLRSELAQEIISRKPGFLEKWSLLVFLGILLLMFGGTWFVHYPDIITTRAVIIAENGPAQITVKYGGMLTKLLVKNNANVKKNQLIGWIENDADPEEIIKLSNEVDKVIGLLASNNPEKINTVFSINFHNLGEMQQYYEQFLLTEEGFNKSGFGKLRFAGSNDGSLRLRLFFRTQLLLLKSRIDDFALRYLIKAPVNGQVSFSNMVHENSYLKGGSSLGYVIPNNTTYYSQTVLPQNNFGKIDTGLRVQLRLDAYPYEEWGFLEGTISYISNIPNETGFAAIIRLNNGLLTNDKKPIAIKSGLRAQAMIITKDMRLLQRFYYGFVKSTSIDK